MRALYTGHEALTFTDYIDQETGRTLHAEPGQVYDVALASGRLAGDIPVPWFVPAGEPPAAPEPEAEAGPEAQPEPEPVPEPGTEEGQSF